MTCSKRSVHFLFIFWLCFLSSLCKLYCHIHVHNIIMIMIILIIINYCYHCQSFPPSSSSSSPHEVFQFFLLSFLFPDRNSRWRLYSRKVRRKLLRCLITLARCIQRAPLAVLITFSFCVYHLSPPLSKEGIAGESRLT